MTKWQTNSWRNFPIKQQPTYKNLKELQKIEKELSGLPPLIFAKEARSLKKDLSKVEQGKAFLLQGGDCAESFSDFNANNIKNLFKLLLQMAVVLIFSNQKPVVKIGRIAGQFAKPRSDDFETIGDISLPSYRGDIINDIAFNAKGRDPDPQRLLKAYYQSASTLNLVRAFSTDGLANLNKIHNLNLEYMSNSNLEYPFVDIANKITHTLDFMKACGANPSTTRSLKQTKLYTSHEALLLNYEEALTRVDSLSGDYYDCSAHMVWIGERTRGLDDAHIEFFRGIKNPLGCKISDKISDDELIALCNKLNPDNESGRLTLIVRMGVDNIKKHLPRVLRVLKKEGKKVVLSCDPMHANTKQAKNGYKTRMFEDIMSEVKSFFEICRSEDFFAGGIHLEMSGDDVTECTGSISSNIKEFDLANRYKTQCDPRLNAKQSLELVFNIAQHLKDN
jgi:3-deoxy-7-phosphoheptulonate synthase